jgi:PTS system mannose-specific IIA component
VFRGRPERIEAIDVTADQDPARSGGWPEAIARLDDGSGVLVITDIKGGTPSNCCNRCASRPCGSHRRHQPADAAARHHLPPRHLDVVVEMALAGGQNGAVRVDNRVRVGFLPPEIPQQ